MSVFARTETMYLLSATGGSKFAIDQIARRILQRLVHRQPPARHDVVGGHGHAVGPAGVRIEAEAEGLLVVGNLPVRGERRNVVQRRRMQTQQALVHQPVHIRFHAVTLGP